MGRYSPTVQPTPFDLGRALAPIGDFADEVVADRRVRRAQALSVEQARLGRAHDVALENMRETHDTAEAGLNRAERRSLQLGQFTHEDTMQGKQLQSEEERAAMEQGTRIYLGSMQDQTSRYIANQSNQTQRYGINKTYDIQNRSLGLEGIKTGALVQDQASLMRERDAQAAAASRRGGLTAHDVIEGAKAVSPMGFSGDSTDLAALDNLTTRAAGLTGANTPAAGTTPVAGGRTGTVVTPAAPASALQQHTLKMTPEEIAAAIQRQNDPKDYARTILTHVHPTKQAAVRKILLGGG